MIRAALANLPERALGAALLLGLAAYLLLPTPGQVLGVVGAAVTGSLRPRTALVAAFGLLPLYRFGRPLAGQELAPAELMLLVAAAGTTLHAMLSGGQGRRRFRWPGSAFDWPAALLLASALLSLLVTEYLRLSLRELRTLLLEPVLAYYLLQTWFPARSMLWPLGAFVTSAAGLAAVGLVGLPLGWGTSEAEGVRRLQVTYASANHLGLFLGRALPFAVALAWCSRKWRGPALTAATALVGALAATFSAGAWLGSGAALLALIGRLAGWRKAALTLALLGGLALLSLALVPSERLSARLDPSQSTTFIRLRLWESSLAMIADHPLLGVGLDNFLYLYQQRYIHPAALAEANLSHPHNLVLHFWLQLGLLGLVSGLWLVGRAIWMAWRLAGPTADDLGRALGAGALGSLVDFVVHGQIDNSYFLPDLAMIFWLTLAVLAVEARLHVGPANARAGGTVESPAVTIGGWPR